MIAVDGLTKHFGGITALADVELTIQPGRVSGVIGPNGAGKTTLLNCISGFYRPTAGTIRVDDGREITRWPVNRRVRELGMLRTFQKVRLFPELDAVDNVVLGMYRSRPYGMLTAIAGRRGRHHIAQRRAATSLLAEAGLRDDKWHSPVGELGHGQQRLIELARTAAASPRYLLLDEPTSGMNEIESRGLAAWTRRRAEEGVGVLLVSHDMPLVMENCDHVTVINFGRRIAQGAPAEVSRNPEVVAAYLGETDDDDPTPDVAASGKGPA